MPWMFAAGQLPDGPLRIIGGLVAPVPNLGILVSPCRWLQKA